MSSSVDHKVQLKLKSSSEIMCSYFEQPTGVFSRLDKEDRSEDMLKSVTVAVNLDEEEDSDGEGSVLQYAGVLKSHPLTQKKKTVTKAAPTSLRRLGGKFKHPPSASRTSSSASSFKILPPAKRSVLQRLGKLPAASAVVSATPADTQDNKVTSSKPRALEKATIASCKVSSSTGAAGAVGGESVGAKMDVKAVSVFKRLGSKHP